MDFSAGRQLYRFLHCFLQHILNAETFARISFVTDGAGENGFDLFFQIMVVDNNFPQGVPITANEVKQRVFLCVKQCRSIGGTGFDADVFINAAQFGHFFNHGVDIGIGGSGADDPAFLLGAYVFHNGVVQFARFSSSVILVETSIKVPNGRYTR